MYLIGISYKLKNVRLFWQEKNYFHILGKFQSFFVDILPPWFYYICMYIPIIWFTFVTDHNEIIIIK